MPRAGFLKAMARGPALQAEGSRRAGAGTRRGDPAACGVSTAPRRGRQHHGGTGCRRVFFHSLACLSFVSTLLCKLQSFTSFTLGSEAAPLGSAQRLRWGRPAPREGAGPCLGTHWVRAGGDRAAGTGGIWWGKGGGWS